VVVFDRNGAFCSNGGRHCVYLKGEKYMTEREEFELVAKTAGYDFNWMTSHGDRNSYIWSEEGIWREWNPKADDGDSKRLQVDLGISIHIYDDNVEAWLLVQKNQYKAYSKKFKDHPDKYAAVRAAVWDVAVEVAKRRMEK
jgi:hypothetical protein